MEKELKVIEERETITTEEDIDKNNHAYFENNENELNNENENREFYVYEHIRLDNMTCFYIGKGKGERAYELERNDHHDNISNMWGHAVLIIKNNLTEEEAFELERDTIEDYVFNLGYGIDIKGYDDYDHELPHLTNMTWGGEGCSGRKHSEEEKQKISEKNKGKNPYANKTSEEMETIRRKISEKNKGKNPYANKTREEIKIISNKISNSMKGKNTGKKSVLWGKPSPNRSKVICITTGKIFNSQTEASNYYNVVRNNISRCCRGELKSAGKLQDGTKLQWKHLEDYNNEFKGILINPWNKGKKFSEEHKQKIGESNIKKVICITTGKIFNSQSEAAIYYNVAQSNISACCRKKIQSAGKLPNDTPLKWKYVKDYNNEFKGILINPITE